MIKCRDVNLRLNNKLILKSINCQIMPGDIIGLIGKNGSGKSTLLRLLAGVYCPDSGFIEKTDEYSFYGSLGVGFLPNLTTHENIVRFLLLNNKEDEIKNEIKLRKLIKQYELDEYLNLQFKHLSSGFKLRVYFLCFSLIEFNNLMLDEFFGFADKKIAEKFINFFMKKDSIFIVSSHNISLINKYCNRIIKLDEGFIVEDKKLNI